MNPIGGYFGLDLPHGPHKFHQGCLALKSGRAALSLILQELTPKKIYLPFYACDTLLDPVKAFDVNYEFYEVDLAFEPVVLPQLRSGELFVYINYFGLKDDYSRYLSNRYEDQLILDCTQAFFYTGDGTSWVFNSARKFFGTVDGAYLYVPQHYEELLQIELMENTKYIAEHLFLRWQGRTEEGYPFFQENEELIDHAISGMSGFSSRVLSNLNYRSTMEARRNNFLFYQDILGGSNRIALPGLKQEVPYFYPYLAHKKIDMGLFHRNKIFSPVLWVDCLQRGDFEKIFSTTYELVRCLSPLPVDQRYTPNNLERVVDLVKAI